MKLRLILTIFIILASLTAHGADKKDKLEKLVNVMDMDAMVDSMYSEMEKMLKNISTQMEIKESEQAKFDKYYTQMIGIIREDISWNKMKPSIIELYDKNFSEEEITYMLNFYQTDVGQNILKKMPVVMQESMQLGQALMQKSLPKIREISKSLSDDIAKSRQKKN